MSRHRADLAVIERQWYCLRTATRQEARCVENLKEQKIEVFMPASARWRRLRSTKTRIETALFPGYLFILATPKDFYRIRAVEGVHQFVRVMNDAGEFEPMPFPAEAIGDLMARQELGEFDATKNEKPRYEPKVGDKATITHGPWTGYIAEILSLTPSERKARVSMDGKFGGKLTLDIAHLDAA